MYYVKSMIQIFSNIKVRYYHSNAILHQLDSIMTLTKVILITVEDSIITLNNNFIKNYKINTNNSKII